MKAFILNSGRGTRMAGLTMATHKSMVKLLNGETIFERQIRILIECGIKDFIITVGYLKNQLIEASKNFSDVNFIFIENPEYEITNYIYSMHLAGDYLNGDMLFLHGDLVFNKQLVLDILENTNRSVCLYNETKELPKKDFKARIQNGLLKEVSVNIFDSDCYAFQPFYKLSKENVAAWKNEIEEFVQNGNVHVYAENALNNILNDFIITTLSYKDNYIEEIDNEEDYKKVSNEIKYYDYREQEIYFNDTLQNNLDCILQRNNIFKVFIVASDNRSLSIKRLLQNRAVEFISFSDFSQNPKYEEIKNGVELFAAKKCDFIISIGGGSTIDAAKCIKLFSKLDVEFDFLKNKYNYSNVKHLAIPTTAGTGSESTRFAVIYHNGEKQSIAHDSILPNYVILDHTFLPALPEYYKKSAILDALCQAIESYWAKCATLESKEYSKKAITLILNNYKNYLSNNEQAGKNMLLASNFSGRAINITSTTGPHAMSYKLTSLYGISHGHAVGLCLPYVWEYMHNIINVDSEIWLNNVFLEISQLLECDSIDNAIKRIKELYQELNLPNVVLNTSDIKFLASSVNLERLNNNPIELKNKDIEIIYTKITCSGQNKNNLKS